MEPENFCKTIVDTDKKITFAGLYSNGLIYSKTQDGLENLLSETEIVKSFAGSSIRYASRKFFESKLGNVHYTLTRHDKMIRVTIPLSGNDLLLFHTDPDADIINLIDKVLAVMANHK